MKQGLLTLVGLATLLSTAACHKAAPVAQRPPDPTPVAEAPRQQPPLQQRAAATPRASCRSEAAAPPRQNGALTPAERASLNQSLARLEDALFDYDKATIRTDASAALRDDVNVIRDILANYGASC